MLNQSGFYRDKTMADKLMYILNTDAKNYLFCRLQLAVKTFGHSAYCPTNQKLLDKTINKKNRYHTTLGTCVINSPLAP